MDQREFDRIKEAIRDRTDIVDLVSELVHVAETGSVWRGKSPWNVDNDPSLTVWPATQTWRDFSGGGSEGGDCFKWVMRAEGVRFFDAMRILAARAAIPMPGQDDAEMQELAREADERRNVEDLLSVAASYYNSVLPEEIRREWLHDRYGLGDEIIDEVQIGWADGLLWNALVDEYGATPDEALATGLFIRIRNRVHDFFKGRIVFPYWCRGRVAYMIGRETEHTPNKAWERGRKYKKLLTRTDKRDYISATVQNRYFYNEDAARQARGETVHVTEGVTDCLAAMQHHIPIISPVTTRFRDKDIPKLLDLTRNALRVVITNDNDPPHPVTGIRSGLKGCIDTATALVSEGRDVRIVELPSPTGEKVDLCEYLRDAGLKAYENLVKSSPTLASFLINQVDVGTSRQDLDEALCNALVMAAAQPPARRDAHIIEVVDRFGLGRRVVEAMFRRASDTAKSRESDGEGPRMRGEIWADEDCPRYLAESYGGTIIAVSSFTLRPIQRLSVDETEVIEAEILTQSGASCRVQLPLASFRSKAALLSRIPIADAQWTGSDDHVQGLLKTVVDADPPKAIGSRRLGRVDTAVGPRWVSRGEVLCPPGEELGDVTFVDNGSSLAKRIHYGVTASHEAREAAKIVLPNLEALNISAAMVPLIGWFFAATVKPVLMKLSGHFPFLCLWGTHGAGKTTLAVEVMWPMLGVIGGQPYSATSATEFALLKLLSSSNSVPAVLDEYKPYTMVAYRRERLHTLLHEVYVGAAPERGRADQTTVSYGLTTPLCLVGESRPSSPPLLERMVTSRPEKDACQALAEEFKTVQDGKPALLAADLAAFSLSRNVEADLAWGLRSVDLVLAHRRVPHRVRDNLAIMATGVLMFEEFAEHMGVTNMKSPDLEGGILAVVADLLEDAPATRNPLDLFFEELAVIAIRGGATFGREYTVTGDGHIAVHFSSAHAAFSEHCRRANTDIEIADRQSLRRQIREECARDTGYITANAKLVYFGKSTDRRRAVIVDPQVAQARGICLDGLISAPISEYERATRRS